MINLLTKLYKDKDLLFHLKKDDFAIQFSLEEGGIYYVVTAIMVLDF